MFRSIRSLVVMTLIASPAFAAYDSSFFVTEFWSGEWPHGYAVIQQKVIVNGRKAMDRDLAKDIACELPYRAVLNPWNLKGNKKRNVHYWTASPIIKLVALKDFELGEAGGKLAKVKKGDIVEYLIYGGEGYFTVRYNGVEFGSGQELFEDGRVSAFPDPSPRQEEWLVLNCANGQKGVWIDTNDLVTVGSKGEDIFIKGIANGGIGSAGVPDYGKARDLTEKEAQNGG